jgi:hypothetical protein
MAEITCARCGGAVGEQDLLCPHCGEATIPQLSKAELVRRGREVEAGSAGLRAGFYGGAAAGAVVGVVGVVGWLASGWVGRPLGAGDLVVLAVTLGVGGAVAGLLVQKLLGR